MILFPAGAPAGTTEQKSRDGMPSARQVDQNGYINVDDNPISREGVFPYLGKSIDSDGTLGLDPNKVYNVYRPASELRDPACIDSFKNLPLIDDHAMLGPSKDGFTPAEKKGIHGTTGERVDFRDGVLYSNLKIFSETLANLLAKGKKDLSIGYRCLYEKAAGTFAGMAYDFIQRSLRGNHIALVDQARCDVAVLDGHITMDHFDLNLKQEDRKMTLDEAEKEIARLTKITADQKVALDAATAKDAEEEEKMKKEKEAKDAEEAAEKEKADKMAKDAEEEEKKKKEGMDSRISAMDAEIKDLKKGGIKALMSEISKRDALASQLSQHVGTFDHAEMTVAEVAEYGVTKLGIKCDKGQEAAVLAGYLHGRPNPASGSTTFDASDTKSKGLDAYINKKSA